MSQSIEQIVFDELNLALQLGEDPAAQAVIAGVSPMAAALMKLIPAFMPAIQGLETIALAGMGNPSEVSASAPVPPAAIQAIQDHNTPGAPDAPALSAGLGSKSP